MRSAYERELRIRTLHMTDNKLDRQTDGRLMP